MNDLARRVILFASLTLAAAFGISAAWIPVKAQVAQVLLHRAWNLTRSGAPAAKP